MLASCCLRRSDLQRSFTAAEHPSERLTNRALQPSACSTLHRGSRTGCRRIRDIGSSLWATASCSERSLRFEEATRSGSVFACFVHEGPRKRSRSSGKISTCRSQRTLAATAHCICASDSAGYQVIAGCIALLGDCSGSFPRGEGAVACAAAPHCFSGCAPDESSVHPSQTGAARVQPFASLNLRSCALSQFGLTSVWPAASGEVGPSPEHVRVLALSLSETTNKNRPECWRCWEEMCSTCVLRFMFGHL